MSEPQNTKLPSQLPSSGGPALERSEGPALERSEGPNAPPPSRRGGRRRGAGAPRGNTNALTTGRYSQRVRALEEVLEDLSGYAYLIWSVAGSRQEELRRLAFALQCDAEALLNELRAATGSRDRSNDPFRFTARSTRRRLASGLIR